MSDAPIVFQKPNERTRWLATYESRLTKGDYPTTAERFASDDMLIRRRVSAGAGDVTEGAEDSVVEGPHFPERFNVYELVPYFAENGYPCVSAPHHGLRQVGRLEFASGALVRLFASGKASIQGSCTDTQRGEIRGLLRAALWEVK